jgi:hypothetical protein
MKSDTKGTPMSDEKGLSLTAQLHQVCEQARKEGLTEAADWIEAARSTQPVPSLEVDAIP